MTRRIHLLGVAELQPTDRTSHESWMALALAEACRNPAAPFGAIIIDRETGNIACKGVNRDRDSPSFHGEIATINACAKAHPGLNWKRMAIYTTAEPCPMCAGAIAWAGIGEVVFGTSVKKLISLGVPQIDIGCLQVFRQARFFHCRIISGVLVEQSDEMYRDWAATHTKPQ